MIHFNVPPYAKKAYDYIQECVVNQKICGDGLYTKKCNEWIERKTGTAKCLLTTSCTHAIELAALLIPDIEPGDEVIMPSFTFSSTADAFVLRGAVPVFVDIRPDTMNMDEKLVAAAVTERTKAIVPVHYAGVACEMDTIMKIAKRHGLVVIEDAAQGIMSTYKGRALGAIGNFGCFSFHETKNYSMGEGGALLIREQKDVEQAEIIREKGTNRSKFYRGQIDKYTWINYGSSYLPSDMNAAYLYAQLEIAEEINEARLASASGKLDTGKFGEYNAALTINSKSFENNTVSFDIKLNPLAIEKNYYVYKNEFASNYEYLGFCEYKNTSVEDLAVTSIEFQFFDKDGVMVGSSDMPDYSREYVASGESGYALDTFASSSSLISSVDEIADVEVNIEFEKPDEADSTSLEVGNTEITNDYEYNVSGFAGITIITNPYDKDIEYYTLLVGMYDSEGNLIGVMNSMDFNGINANSKVKSTACWLPDPREIPDKVKELKASARVTSFGDGE